MKLTPLAMRKEPNLKIQKTGAKVTANSKVSARFLSGALGGNLPGCSPRLVTGVRGEKESGADFDELILILYPFRGRDGGIVNPPLSGIALRDQIAEQMV